MPPIAVAGKFCHIIFYRILCCFLAFYVDFMYLALTKAIGKVWTYVLDVFWQISLIWVLRVLFICLILPFAWGLYGVCWSQVSLRTLLISLITVTTKCGFLFDDMLKGTFNLGIIWLRKILTIFFLCWCDRGKFQAIHWRYQLILVYICIFLCGISAKICLLIISWEISCFCYF